MTDTGDTPTAPAPFRWGPAVVRAFCALWVLGLVTRSLLFLYTTGKAMTWPSGGGLAMASVIGIRLIGNAPATVLRAVLAVAALRGFATRKPGGLVGAAVAACAILTLEVFRLASWNEFMLTGRFLDAGALAFAHDNVALLIEHGLQLEGLRLLLVPLAGVAIAATDIWLARLMVGLRPSRALRTTGLVIGALMAAGAVLTVANWRALAHPQPPAAELGAGPTMSPLNAGGAESSFLFGLIFASDEMIGPSTSDPTGAMRSGPALVPPEAYAAEAAGAKPHRWNVIVVLVESLRATELAAYGSPRAVMPTVDSLAKASTVYLDVDTPAGQSDYATTSIMASQWPLRLTAHQGFRLHIPYPRVVLADPLKAAGWRTAIMSSQNEYWNGMLYFMSTGGFEHVLHAETYRGPTYVPKADSDFALWLRTTKLAGKIDDRNTIDEAIAWTDSAGRKPFFAYVNLQSSHTPYVQPAGVPPKFGNGRVSFDVMFGEYPADSAAAVHDLYDNSLAYADAQLGRLFAHLKQTRRWDSTVVIIAGDHGEGFFEHGFGAHAGPLAREVRRVPLIVHVPGRRAAIDSVPASAIDIPPTVLGILGLPPHPGFQGVDLASERRRVHRPRFTLTQNPLGDEVTLEQDGWMLRFDIRNKTISLYDEWADPGEHTDVAREHPAELNALYATLSRWWTDQLAYYRSGSEFTVAYPPPTPVARPIRERK